MSHIYVFLMCVSLLLLFAAPTMTSSTQILCTVLHLIVSTIKINLVLHSVCFITLYWRPGQAKSQLNTSISRSSRLGREWQLANQAINLNMSLVLAPAPAPGPTPLLTPTGMFTLSCHSSLPAVYAKIDSCLRQLAKSGTTARSTLRF